MSSILKGIAYFLAGLGGLIIAPFLSLLPLLIAGYLVRGIGDLLGI